MKIVLDVANKTKIEGLPTNSVILYDGKQWYITTKQDLMSEIYTNIAEKNNAIDAACVNMANNINTLANQYNQLVTEFNQFKKDVAQQIYELAGLVKTLYTSDNESN